MKTVYFIAVRECADGNASVGTEWLETKRFHEKTKISDIWQWAQMAGKGKGRLIITRESLPDLDDKHYVGEG